VMLCRVQKLDPIRRSVNHRVWATCFERTPQGIRAVTNENQATPWVNGIES